MSQENVETGADVEALAAGGVESALAFLSAHVAWYPFPEWVAQIDIARRLAHAIWHMLSRKETFAP